MTRESAIKRSILQFAAAYAVVLLLVVREEVVGALSPKGLGVAGLLLMVGGSVFLASRFRAINRTYKSAEQPALVSGDPVVHQKLVRSIRSLRVGLFMMPTVLIYALFATKGESVFPRITGAVMNLLITWAFYKALRAQKAKLHQLSNRNMQ